VRVDLVQGVDRAAEVGDDDGAADDQPHVEGLEELVVGDALFLAADDVVGDAVVAAQHHRRDQAEQLLGLHVECAGLVAAGVEREEALDLEVAGLQDALVHALAEPAEFFQAVRHRRSPSGGCKEPRKLRGRSDSVKPPKGKASRRAAEAAEEHRWIPQFSAASAALREIPGS